MTNDDLQDNAAVPVLEQDSYDVNDVMNELRKSHAEVMGEVAGIAQVLGRIVEILEWTRNDAFELEIAEHALIRQREKDKNRVEEELEQLKRNYVSACTAAGLDPDPKILILMSGLEKLFTPELKDEKP